MPRSIQRFSIFAAGDPVGLNSTVHPAALGPNEFPELQNFRYRNRVLRVRDGSALIKAAPAAGLTYLGHWCTSDWGSTVGGQKAILVAAFGDATAGKADIYTLGFYSGAYSWVKQTDDGTSSGLLGAFGDTRFSSATAKVEFARVTANWYGKPRDFLVATNGVDAPRVINVAIVTPFLGRVCPVFAPSYPTVGAQYVYTPTFPKYFSVGSGTRTYVSKDSGGNAQTDFVLSTDTTLTQNRIKLVCKTTASIDDYSSCEFPAAVDLSKCKQLILRVDENAAATVMDRVKVEISEAAAGGTCYTVYDPSVSTYQAPAQATDTVTGVTYYIYDITHIAEASRNATLLLQLTFKGPVLAADQTAYIHLVAGSGNIQGVTAPAFAFRNEFNCCESPRFALAATASPLMTALGGANTSGNEDRLLVDAKMYYTYDVSVGNPNAGANMESIGTYPTSVDFYLRATATDPYTFYGMKTVYAFDTGADDRWEGTAGAQFAATLGSVPIGDSTFNTLYGDGLGNFDTPNEFLYPPDEYGQHMVMPSAKYVAASNYRLFVGNVNSYAKTRTVWFSEDRQPFRFRTFQRVEDGIPDPGSGCSVTFDDTVTGLSRIPGTAIGAVTIVVATKRSMWQLTGVDTSYLARPSELSPTGCRVNRTMAVGGTAMYWAGPDSQVRVLNASGEGSVSDQSVVASLRAGTLTSSTSAVWDERVYLAYQKSGDATLRRILVYDMPTGKWTEDYVAWEIGAITLNDDGVNPPALLLITAAGAVYEYEKSATTQENSLDIPVRLATRIIEAQDSEFAMNALEMQADKVANGTLAVARTWIPVATAGTSTAISLASANAKVWVRTAPGQGLGRGVGVSLVISGSLPGGTNIYHIRGVVNARDGVFNAS